MSNVSTLTTDNDQRTESGASGSAADFKSTVPGVSTDSSAATVELLQDRLTATIDLQLTLKHIHWNVVGMNFIAVHEMLDPQVDAVRAMSDALAERIATMGGEPVGTPGAVASMRSWNDYDLGRAPSVKHLVELDKVYSGVIADHRDAQARLADLDPVSEDMMIAQLHELELFQWFVRAHLMDGSGDVIHRQT